MENGERHKQKLPVTQVAYVRIRSHQLDPRDFVPFPSQKQGFGVPVVIHKHPDKTQLRETIFLMRQDGMSYREIGHQLDIDASRVWQIIKTAT